MSGDTVRLFLCVCLSYFGGTGVTGFNMFPSISAEKAVFGNNTFTLTCQYELNSNENIYFIQLIRQRTGSATEEYIILFQKGRNATTQDSLLESRTTLTNPTVTSRTITVKFNDIICSDRASYMWKSSYFDGIQTAEMIKSVTMIVKAITTFDENVPPSFSPSSSIGEGNDVTFTCTGDVGAEPRGDIRWYYFLDGSNTGGVDISSQATAGTPVFSDESCSWTQTSSVVLTMTRQFNDIVVRCEVQQEQVRRYTQTPQIPVTVRYQVQMNISPGEVVLSSSTPVSTTFTCTISSSLSISRIFTMQIKRQMATDTSFTVLAEVTNTNINPTIVTSAPQDIITRATVSGGIDTNTPAASTLLLTMNTADVTCDDRGDYQCFLVYQATDSSVPTAEHNKTLSVYALPSDVSLIARKNGKPIQGTASDEADVNVGEAVKFTCTAIIGSDNTTKIRWMRTSEHGAADNFLVYNPPQGTYTEGTPTPGSTDCTYSRTDTMTYTVTSIDAKRDNNLAFKCYVSVKPPGQDVYETYNPSPFYINPNQVQMNISPAEVVLTSSSPVSTTFTCSIFSSPNINGIFIMQIKRQRATDTRFTVLAEVSNTYNNPVIVTNAPQDIITRATVSGGIDTNTPTASTLILTMNTADVTCDDRGDYQCVLVYQATDSSVLIAEHNKTLSVYALPSDVSLIAGKNGKPIRGTVSDEADVNVGEAVKFTCTAIIGSDNTTKIRWMQTSEHGAADNFLVYNPPPGTYTEGTPNPGSTDCTYSRTDTMTYTVTSVDAKRDNNLAFKCFVSVKPPGQDRYETYNPSPFYINPRESGSVAVVG